MVLYVLLSVANFGLRSLQWHDFPSSAFVYIVVYLFASSVHCVFISCLSLFRSVKEPSGDLFPKKQAPIAQRQASVRSQFCPLVSHKTRGTCVGMHFWHFRFLCVGVCIIPRSPVVFRADYFVHVAVPFSLFADCVLLRALSDGLRGHDCADFGH